ncbi:cobalamin biosynthesis protein CobD [Fusobacterium hominis]|uniref:Cobalamin biosynthesis protein CobD n=1 Tax=Fusobacterium hominis TaxID=2764326 RepID=A0A7G9GZG9_9FUSO|nr:MULTISPECIES: adenosylcobinamide-phosphate synthase CbiB [Fusobacterium]QNM16201.1 cobalamin biosynthesis protein CobD [Fusobacterium hominis]
MRVNFLIKYSIAYILDLILGDPHWFPHPVRFIGKLITMLEGLLYRFKCKKFTGGVLAVLTIAITFIVSFILAKISVVLEIFFLYTTLATKSLASEGFRVCKILVEGDMEKAKKELSYLVSRDTENMNVVQITRSVLETISENSVDGVIAPMFFAFLGSLFSIDGVSLALPFAMGYKAINTLDSMVGYKNEKYMNFGTVSARIDDIANFIPARLSGGLIIPIAAFILRYDYKSAWRIFFRDRLNHSSPNSGNSEAAFAGALGVQFGGKTSYFGKIHNKPTIGDKLKNFGIPDVKKGIRLLYVTSWVGMVIFTIIYSLISYIK